MFHMPNRSVPAHALAKVNFPLYVIKTLTERHILVAGGGGETNSGIKNCIEIYELFKCPKSDTCRARRVAHFDTGTRAVMNATLFQKGDYFILATGGRFGTCVFYKIKFKIEDDFIDELENKENQQNYKNGVIRRRTSSGILANGNASLKDEDSKSNKLNHDNQQQINLTFEISRVTEFQADFDKNREAYLKMVKYSSTAKLIVTGGSDGCIRLFGYPDLKLLTTIPAHKDEIKSLTIDSTGYRLVSISRDRQAYVWNLKERSKLKELKLNLNNHINGKKIEYEFRDCKFGINCNDPKQTILYTIHNPFVRTKPPCKSLICKWNTKSYEIDNLIYANIEPFSELTISEDGKFLGAGLLNGDVEIYDTINLKKLYTMKNSHKLFVTGVEFLKSLNESKMLAGDHESSLLSISVDNSIVVHHLPKQDTIGLIGSPYLFVFTLFVIYVLFSLLGL